ncbi:hypothetical protein [Marinitenerispora sediminis]|uniref:Uncharacterized protein n=1 Tax=Marinitenerispora sediminis TaxID=1931232 RepID=A0A368SXV5_9ACTN|nr:hypothetical protein [Marinitenerispora sediminis]RCV47858.1 hypothetical protein DEF24_26755 [Marinitenerispora sediminis]RCV51457.1 hypothetical protein DEF28_15425 [Marinitenerispora sediminis]RCV55237.1 hypothetical protein DEF23_14570 [Marinitenerispora sediminis]
MYKTLRRLVVAGVIAPALVLGAPALAMADDFSKFDAAKTFAGPRGAGTCHIKSHAHTGHHHHKGKHGHHGWDGERRDGGHHDGHGGDSSSFDERFTFSGLKGAKSGHVHSHAHTGHDRHHHHKHDKKKDW